MADAFRIIPYQVRSAGTDVPPEEVQAGINSLANQTTIALNTLNTGESSNVNITGGTITGVTGATQPRLDNSLLLATDQFVNQQIASSTAGVPFPLSNGVYNQASRGSGVSFVILVSGGVITSVVTIISGGTNYAVGDLLVVPAGNDDGILRVTSVSGGVVQPGGLQVIYGGTGYTTGATTGAVDVPPGQRSVTFTGVLTGNVTFIIQNGTFLTASRRVQFNNNTTGAFTVTVFLSNGLGGTTGSGVVLPQGTNDSSAVMVQTDGVNDVWLSNTPLGIGAGATSGPLSQFAATTSAQLLGVISDETGTGSLVFAGSPTFTGTAAFAALTATGTITPSQTNGIVGTTTNNNANAGSVGEYVANQATLVAITTNTASPVTSVSLTAGDWDVGGIMQTQPAGTTTQGIIAVGINTASNAFQNITGALNNDSILNVTIPAGATQTVLAPLTRISLASTTTVFLVGLVVYGTSTLTVAGQIRARRIR